MDEAAVTDIASLQPDRRLRVQRGRVRYCLDGETPEETLIESGGTAVIEPEVPHHVELLDADSAFLVEFHRVELPQ